MYMQYNIMQYFIWLGIPHDFFVWSINQTTIMDADLAMSADLLYTELSRSVEITLITHHL
jgi:hypothetical protein